MIIATILGCTAMTGLLSYTLTGGGSFSEASKIQRIAANCGLNVKEGKKTYTLQLLRRQRSEWGMEYIYRIPLGRSFNDILAKQENIEDGLNNKRGILDITLDDIKQLRLRSDLLDQIKKLFGGSKARKEVLMHYDGTLHIKVYNDPMPEKIGYELDGGKGWEVCLGYAREQVVYHDFDKVPMLVVAGTIGYGKSVTLKNIITTLIHRRPDDVTFTLIDLKGGLAFNRFANCRQVLTVAKSVPEALEALQEVHAAILDKQADYLKRGVEDYKEAGDKRRHFVIVDEGAELASKGEADSDRKVQKVECEYLVAEIARIGRGLGFKMAYATQYPTADTLPRQVKQNCDARLCFRLQTDTASQVVLDESGAEKLPLIKGRAIYQTDRKLIVQTPLIENSTIDKAIRPHITIKPRKEPRHHEGNPIPEAGARRGDSLIIEEA